MGVKRKLKTFSERNNTYEEYSPNEKLVIYGGTHILDEPKHFPILKCFTQKFWGFSDRFL